MKKTKLYTVYTLNEFTGGWFIGKFIPNIFCENFELGVKTYEAGEVNPEHYHKLTDELTVIITGLCEFNLYDPGNDKRECITLQTGDMILIPKGTLSEFVAIEKTTLVVYKNKSIPGDKYSRDL